MTAARGGSTRPAKSSGKQHRPIKRGRWHPITAIQRPWQAMPLRTRLTLMTTGLLAIGLEKRYGAKSCFTDFGISNLKSASF